MTDTGYQRQHYEFDEFRLYPQERLLLKDKKRVALTPRVLDLLIVLVRHDGELVRKDELLNSIWPDSFVEEGNISRAVSTLRKNLGVQSNGSDFIETVPKLGYRFVAPVHKGLVDVSPPRRIKTDRRLLLAAAGALSVIVMAVFAFYFWERAGPVPTAKTEAVRLTDHPLHDTMPRWANDGRIRFLRSDGK